MKEYAGTILICLLLLAGVIAAAASLLKRKKRGCGCGCDHCAGCTNNKTEGEEDHRPNV